MAIAMIRGVSICYEVLGDDGPWVVLTPGGRGAKEAVRSVGLAIAAAGHRVVLHDRRNCGASDVVIDGDESEQEIWADDLHELLDGLGALPVYAGGGSAGCRLSLLLTLRHPGSTRGLLLWSVTGGHVAADRLGESYYGQFIDAARAGGMAAVCESPFFADRIRQNPSNGPRLLAMDVDRFCEVMDRWRDFFRQGADLPVIGGTEAALKAITIPACIVPGNDAIHPHHVGERLASILPHAELHDLFTPGEREALGPGAMAESQRRLSGLFVDFLSRVSRD